MPRRASTVERREALFREAVAIIERDYARPVEVNAVAREIATSRRQLQRVFSEMGTDFRTVLREVRMRRAVDLLQTENMPVKRVAHSVGYRQPAEFAKTFRRQMGAAPSKFKGPQPQAPRTSGRRP
jgi:AraC family transcriptional regulator, regulatory protein of adaptative response / methylphosphotriester-DNA alkyltransferase methyltransferase